MCALPSLSSPAGRSVSLVSAGLLSLLSWSRESLQSGAGPGQTSSCPEWGLTSHSPGTPALQHNKRLCYNFVLVNRQNTNNRSVVVVYTLVQLSLGLRQWVSQWLWPVKTNRDCRGVMWVLVSLSLTSYVIARQQARNLSGLCIQVRFQTGRLIGPTKLLLGQHLTHQLPVLSSSRGVKLANYNKIYFLSNL